MRSTVCWEVVVLSVSLSWQSVARDLPSAPHVGQATHPGLFLGSRAPRHFVVGASPCLMTVRCLGTSRRKRSHGSLRSQPAGRRRGLLRRPRPGWQAMGAVVQTPRRIKRKRGPSQVTSPVTSQSPSSAELRLQEPESKTGTQESATENFYLIRPEPDDRAADLTRPSTARATGLGGCSSRH